MPPKAFGLRWSDEGEIGTLYMGKKHLWSARATKVFMAVWQYGSRGVLYNLGYSYDRYTGVVKFWETPDHDLRQVRISTALLVIETRVRRRQKREEERQQRIELQRRFGAILGELRRILAERRWAIYGGYFPEIEAFLANGVNDIAALKRAEQIVKRTDKTVENAQKKLAEDPAADDHILCQDPKVRSLVTTAIRHITGNDEDWAAQRNDIGWSKAHTVVGHVLALDDNLSPKHAAHGMSLLRYHHTQVPETIRADLGIA